MRIFQRLLCVILVTFPFGIIFADERPNILWLTAEDIGRHLGCYDFSYAETPVLDRLASNGMRYDFVWSTYPVCAPARTAIITGCYPSSLGAGNMRSSVQLPDALRMYPHYLREAGYYCTNNNKEDYNVHNRDYRTGWDVSSAQAHWKNRQEGQPFFAVFNFTETHEEYLRDRSGLGTADLAAVPIPKHHPDVTVVRADWWKYHENIKKFDTWCAGHLHELQEAGLAENTIVFVYGDHGSGMPRNKRTPLDGGLGVPLIVHFPPKYQHLAPKDYKENGNSGRLVCFTDLAPTVLSLAGVEPPAHMQGLAFAGNHAQERQYVYGFRERMDYRNDLVRSISDGRYVYARNYHPEIIYGVRIDYMWGTPMTRVWRELYDEGTLPPEQAFFWELKPTEELYDLKTDPDEIVNLADSPEHQEIKNRLKSVLKSHLLEIRDTHFLPESMLHERSAGSTPWEMRRDTAKYPMEKILDAADAATDRSTPDAAIKGFLADDEPAIRYWGAVGILIRIADSAGSDGTKPTEATKALLERWQPEIVAMQTDAEATVRFAASEIYGRYGNDAEADRAAKSLIAEAKSADLPHTIWLALESLDRFAYRCGQYRTEIESMTNEKFTGRNGIMFQIMPSITRQLPSR